MENTNRLGACLASGGICASQKILNRIDENATKTLGLEITSSINKTMSLRPQNICEAHEVLFARCFMVCRLR